MTIAKVEKRQSAPFHFEVGFIYGYTDMFICLQGLININGAKWAYIACALFLLVEMQEGRSSEILIRLQSGVQVLYDPLLRPYITQNVYSGDSRKFGLSRTRMRKMLVQQFLF